MGHGDTGGIDPEEDPMGAVDAFINSIKTEYLAKYSTLGRNEKPPDLEFLDGNSFGGLTMKFTSEMTIPENLLYQL